MTLLGPKDFEVGCDECFERLDEYVEGQDVPGMAAHLEGCPACREDYESLLALVRDEREGAQTES
jgi:predicted anti-sigma-YlaC factor YlaD